MKKRLNYLKIFPRISTPADRKLVLKNFFSLSALQGLGYLLPLLVIPYLLRVIGPEKFGLIAFAQALMQYFLIITDYGFSLSATRKIALCKNHQEQICAIFSSVMTVKFILAAISYLILLALINWVPRFKQDWAVFLLSFGAVFGNSLFPVWLFQGKEKMKYIASLNGLAGIANLLCIFYYVRSPADYLYVPGFNSFFALIAGLWGLRVAFSEFNLEFMRRTYKDIRAELRASWGVFTSVVAINAYTATRTFAVGLLTNNTVTGYYSVAERIAGFIQMFPLDSFSQAVYPRLNNIYLKNKKRSVKIMLQIQNITTRGFLIFLPLLFIFSPLIVKIACGQPYNEIVLTLRLLLVSIFFVGANAFRVQFLLIGERADLYSKLHIIAALIGLPLIFFFIYLFSYPGAALSTIIIEIGVIISTGRLLRKTLHPE